MVCVTTLSSVAALLWFRRTLLPGRLGAPTPLFPSKPPVGTVVSGRHLTGPLVPETCPDPVVCRSGKSYCLRKSHGLESSETFTRGTV